MSGRVTFYGNLVWINLDVAVFFQFVSLSNVAAKANVLSFPHDNRHSFGEQMSAKKWAKEAAGQRDIMAAYGGVRAEDIRGLRAPFLSVITFERKIRFLCGSVFNNRFDPVHAQVGGNRMFKMLYDMNFTYDSSMPVYENKPPSWPYTLDYKIFHDCMIPPCPTKSYPGKFILK